MEDFELQTSSRRNQPQRVKGPKRPMPYLIASYQIRIKWNLDCIWSEIWVQKYWRQVDKPIIRQIEQNVKDLSSHWRNPRIYSNFLVKNLQENMQKWMIEFKTRSLFIIDKRNWFTCQKYSQPMRRWHSQDKNWSQYEIFLLNTSPTSWLWWWRKSNKKMKQLLYRR
jgi:hypothetical protein